MKKDNLIIRQFCGIPTRKRYHSHLVTLHTSVATSQPEKTSQNFTFFHGHSKNVSKC